MQIVRKVHILHRNTCANRDFGYSLCRIEASPNSCAQHHSTPFFRSASPQVKRHSWASQVENVDQGQRRDMQIDGVVARIARSAEIARSFSGACLWVARLVSRISSKL